MKHGDDNTDVYKEEPSIERIPDDGLEEIDIERVKWDDI